MAKTVINAKNVVSFNANDAQQNKTAEAVEKTVPEEPFFEDSEPVETRPLGMRKNRYLDESPQSDDWADKDPLETYGEGEEPGSVSTFTEVFIPLHTDSTGTVIRKGMVLVSVIVILCCLVAIIMKHGAVSAMIPYEVSAWTDALTGACTMLWNP